MARRKSRLRKCLTQRNMRIKQNRAIFKIFLPPLVAGHLRSQQPFITKNYLFSLTTIFNFDKKERFKIVNMQGLFQRPRVMNVGKEFSNDLSNRQKRRRLRLYVKKGLWVQRRRLPSRCRSMRWLCQSNGVSHRQVLQDISGTGR